MKGNPHSPLAGPGVEECPAITPTEPRDGFKPGPIVGWWPHGFNLRCLKLETGARVPGHIRDEEEVILVHRGTLEVATPQGTLVLAPATPSRRRRAWSALFGRSLRTASLPTWSAAATRPARCAGRAGWLRSDLLPLPSCAERGPSGRRPCPSSAPPMSEPPPLARRRGPAFRPREGPRLDLAAYDA